MLHTPALATHRLFFALRPPIDWARRAVAASAWLGGETVAAERLHITLTILDDLAAVPPTLIAALRDIGGAVDAAPFAVALDRLVVAGGWAALRPGGNLAPLHDLHDQLARLARAGGIAERPGHHFNPHLTLAYRAAAAPGGRMRSEGWIAGELTLAHSHLGRTRHDVIDRWPLAATEPQFLLF